MPKGGVAECPHPPSPDTCPDGSPMPKGGSSRMSTST